MVDPDLNASNPWIVDSGPLSHFAKAGWLGFFKLVSAGHQVVIPDVVHQELLDGEQAHPHLRSVLDATSTWIAVRTIASSEEMVALARYSSKLVGSDGRKNLGECGVLALAETMPGVAILDDRAGRRAGTDNHIMVRGTVALILDAIREHGLPRDIAAAVADDLLETEYRLPFESGQFLRWAVENGLLEYE